MKNTNNIRYVVASGLVCIAVAGISAGCEGLDDTPLELTRQIQANLSYAERMARYEVIKSAAAARGIMGTGFLLAGIANAETGLAHCWSEATWACQGPNSPDCGGGAVIAGSGDGPCYLQQGGLGMFQFDAGTYSQTLNAYGYSILTVAGNTDQAITFVVNMLKKSVYVGGVYTDAQAIAWLESFDYHNSGHRDVWIKTVTHYYNGCLPSYSCWSNRYHSYSNKLAFVVDETGLPWWGACSPGQTETGDCGYCGHSTRTCQSNYRWGDWGPCEGQGECGAGTVDYRSCCDCGTETRVCSPTCSWGDWGGCSGPDPDNGTRVCDTKEPGPCAEGRVRCIQGCLQCRRIYEPIAEICDEIDNDCSGEVDDGSPTVLGDPPPGYAATLLDSASSYVLKSGEKTGAWAVFRNDGSQPWKQGKMWLAALVEDNSKKTQSLYDPDSWPAHDVAALLTKDVEPGDIALFNWTVKLPDNSSGMSQTFRLMDHEGNYLKCPSPEFVVTLKTGQVSDDSESGPRTDSQATNKRDASARGSEATDNAEDSSSSDGCGCKIGRESGKDRGNGGWLLLGTLAALLVSYQRSRRRDLHRNNANDARA